MWLNTDDAADDLLDDIDNDWNRDGITFGGMEEIVDPQIMD